MSKKWNMTQLGAIADIIMGQSPDSNSYNTDEMGIPFLQGCAEFGAFYPNPELHCFPPLRIAKKDSILISVRAPVGKMNWSDQEYCIGRGLGSVKAKASLANTHFLKHTLDQNSFFLHRRSQGSTFLAVRANDLKLFPVPDIPVKMQEKIAIIINTIDQAIEKTEALIQKYQQMKAGLMNDLFTRGVTADGKLRPSREQALELYKESPIGWIPKEWEVDNICNVFHIQLGKMLSRAAKTGKYSANYLGNKNVQWDKVDLSNLEQMDFTPNEREKYKLIANDLLVCEGGDVGRTSMWRGEMEDCFYQKAIHRLRPKDERVNPSLMLRFMRYAKQVGAFTDFTSQTSIAHLTQEQLGKVKVLIPSLAEQSLMIERFDYIDKKINTETSYFEKLIAQKSGLMHDLLTGKVPVKIDQEETAHD